MFIKFSHLLVLCLITFQIHAANPTGPKIEIQDLKDSYNVKAEVPGMDDEDVKISILDQNLSIRASREKEFVETKKGMTQTEFIYGDFSRLIHLKDKVDPKSLKVEFENGIANIHLKKI